MPGHEAQRTCLGCRESRPKQELVRYVVSPEGDVLADYRQRLPGRGAYTCLNRQCLRETLRRAQFERTFRGRARRTTEDQLLGQLRQQLGARIDSLLGMARKSAQAVVGGNLVLAALEKPSFLRLILCARDSSTNINEKVVRKAAASAVALHWWQSKDHLGQIFGRPEISILGIRDGELALALEDGLKRYEQFLGE